MNAPIIISLGGSLVVPDALDTGYIREIRAFLENELKAGQRFIVIVGGGRTARRYQSAAKEVGADSEEALDWVGIYATRLNAELLRVSFGAHAHDEIITDPSALQGVTKPIAIGAGWKPGWSTDFDSVEMAATVGATRIVNLSNIDYVYEKDPRQFPDARKIERSSWKDFRAILPKDWSPGVNAPFDPVAARRAEELSLEVAIMNGKPLDNLKNYLEGNAFKGTVISPQ